MPPSTPEETTPRFLVEETADDAVATRLRTMERRINENPGLFQTALLTLGDLATEHTIEIDKRDERQVTLKRAAKDMITEFFGQRYDLEMSFDEITEAALSKDETHLKLLKEMRSKGPEYVRKGVMGSSSRPNQEAVPLREIIRRHRLSFYIGRVAAAQQSRAATPKGKLRSTG